MKAKILTLIVATASCLPSFAQEEWDLRKCIDYAIEHNLSIKQQEATRDQNAVELNTARWSRLPNLTEMWDNHSTSAELFRRTTLMATATPKTPISHWEPMYRYSPVCRYPTT